MTFFFFQAEDGIRDLVRSRGLGDVYKRQALTETPQDEPLVTYAPKLDRDSARIRWTAPAVEVARAIRAYDPRPGAWTCLLYTSDAADERSSVDLGGRRIIKKKKTREPWV